MNKPIKDKSGSDMSGQKINDMKCKQCGYAHPIGTTCPPNSSFAAPTGLDDAIGILVNISKEYVRFCDVMITMGDRKSELKASRQFLDALENLRNELLKRKSSNKP